MYPHIKRLLDILFSVFLLVAFAFLILIIALSIKYSMGSPVFFMQVRIGKNNLPFSIIKFRTMKNKREPFIADKVRLTKFGAFLRKTSLDEFPQLINILKGEMSFIGPRPLLADYLPYYNSREILRHNVRPGMTSLASIRGRSYVTWEEQLELDVFYVENLSLSLDLGIFFKTIPKVISSSDMMVIGRIDNEGFDSYRKNQIKENRM